MKLLFSLLAFFSICFSSMFCSSFAQNVRVTFRVNMKKLMCEGKFRPDSSDIVRVAGSFNDWGNSRDTLRNLAPIDSIFEKQIIFNDTMVNRQVQYKFLKTLRSNLDWEGGDNRLYTIIAGTQAIGLTYFRSGVPNDSVCRLPVSGNITWRVDMRAFQAVGWFQPPSDSIQIRGGFNSWGGSPMFFDPLTGFYRLSLPYSGISFDEIQNKYFLKVDTTTAEIRFPGFHTDRDGVQYEHPYSTADRNRQFQLPSIGGNLSSPLAYFDDIHPYGTMNNSTDSCRVTVRVNMSPATRYIDPFIPATDTVRLVWHDVRWAFAQAAHQGIFPTQLVLRRVGPTDSVWSTTFRVKGKAHYGMMYNYRYSHANGVSVDEGGSFQTYTYRVRYVLPLSPNVFPPAYETPLDTWQKYWPLPIEPSPFPLPTIVDEQRQTAVPQSCVLEQNYPNPFNPSTQIRYSLPEQVNVTLRVFNILGQQVAELVNEEQTRGNYVVLFETNDLASGVYLYRLQAGKWNEAKQMLLVK